MEKSKSDPRCEGLDFAAFLLTPIQRLPRYVLLLDKLIKVRLSRPGNHLAHIPQHTDEQHPDFYYIELAMEKMKVARMMKSAAILTKPGCALVAR